MNQETPYMKILVVVAAMIFLSSCLFSINDALAVTTIKWDGDHTINDGAVNSAVTVTFNVTDTSLAGNGITDKINVVVNSTSFPAGIPLTVTESGDTGIFINTNLIFANGTAEEAAVPSNLTVGIHKNALNTNPNVIESIISNDTSIEGMAVFSTTDPTGIFMNLTETGPNTGEFENTLQLTTGPSVNGRAISVHFGDIVSWVDLNNGDFESVIVKPNPDQSLGPLPAKFLDHVSVMYNGIKKTMWVHLGAGPGGGGGGLIQPGFVLDFLSGISGKGGSPYVVQPPSFGGGYLKYSDGLTITEGANTTTLDISKYNQELPQQVMETGQKVTMKFKTYEAYNPNGVIHMGLFIIPRGQDMITPNSLASIQYDKYSPVEINDPNHILANATVSSTSDGKFQYTQFSFVPEKSYDKMSFLARAWNDHLYSTDIRVHDDIILPPAPKIFPTGVFKYENFEDLQSALEKDQFYKPQIMAHIHGTTDIFASSEGKVYWLYDTINHSVTLVVTDKDGNELGSFKQSLEQYVIESAGDYKFMKFTVTNLNRWDDKQEEYFKQVEEAKALLSALANGMNFGNP